jgi:hypothetical protein
MAVAPGMVHCYTSLTRGRGTIPLHRGCSAALPIEEAAMTVKTTTYDSPVDALVALVQALVTYEQRYLMRSAEFFAQYKEGKLEDSADFVEWAGDYQHYLGLLQELKDRLKTVG